MESVHCCEDDSKENSTAETNHVEADHASADAAAKVPMVAQVKPFRRSQPEVGTEASGDAIDTETAIKENGSQLLDAETNLKQNDGAAAAAASCSINRDDHISCNSDSVDGGDSARNCVNGIEAELAASLSVETDGLTGEDDEAAVSEASELVSQLDLRSRDDASSSSDENVDLAMSGDELDENPATKPLELRCYQKELAREALTGKNCLIISSTGTGKTHVALAVAKNHLDPDCFEEDRKVVFFVPTVALVSQQLRQFRTYMDPSVRCQGLSGEEAAGLSLHDVIATNDVLVMTPQVILNALKQKAVHALSAFSLLIFDECHKVMKNHPYNAIMSRHYVDRLISDKDAHCQLPQVIGLTASPGVGKATNTEKAAEYILQLCANMAATEICTVRDENNLKELEKYVNKPYDKTYPVRGRQVDMFKDRISQVMVSIEQEMLKMAKTDSVTGEVPNIIQMVQPPASRGSDPYTQFLSRLKKATNTLQDPDSRRFFMTCIPHLEVYNNALLINADCRTKDALQFIRNSAEFQQDEHTSELNVQEIKKNETDLWLETLFTDIEDELADISESRESENPKLRELERVITSFYTDETSTSQGIVFCRTRAMTTALVTWMKETPSLAKLRPHNLIGANRPTAPGAEAMTHNKLEDVLQYFKDGEHKLIVATTVAEEGLDVRQCNFVIRYEHVTNDIARVQARGRARAGNAHYILVAEIGTGTIERDEANKLREGMLKRALAQIYSWPRDVIDKKLTDLRLKAKHDRDLELQGKKMSEMLKRRRTRDGDYTLRCDAYAATSSDLRKIAGAHHVTLEEDFEKKRVILRPHPKPKKIDNWEMRAKTLCRGCGKADWGIKAIYNGVPCCMLQIKSFMIVCPTGQRMNCKQWKDIPFHVAPMSADDMKKLGSGIVDDDDEAELI